MFDAMFLLALFVPPAVLVLSTAAVVLTSLHHRKAAVTALREHEAV
jgi:hypothetical protein